MKHYRLLIIALGTGLLAASPAALQITRAARPQTATPLETCASAECHADTKQFPVVHGPVNVNACDACHTPVSEKDHTFKLARNETEICTFCHKIDTPPDAVVHKPLKDGDCLACHNPHGGPTRLFLRGKSARDMCESCHAGVTAGKSAVHGPAAAGACDACHPGHVSKFPKLLNAQGRDLCFSCHTEMKTQMTQVKFVHRAAEQECLHCHDAHASNHTMHIRQEPFELCTSCHEHDAVKLAATDATHKHSIVLKDQACLNCHNAHGGDLAKLMRTEQVNMCMKCHGEKIDAGQGRTVAAVKEVLDPKMTKHGPAADGSCGGCHDVHGSQISRLLKKEYPEPFYQPFAMEKYELCFSCHDRQLVMSEKAVGLTNFRNGEVNLHFLHVNKTDKGRNCRACHSVHASTNALHIRESVPFGNWQMPINFEKSDAGGSCAPGCHRAVEYDRDKPVDYTVQREDKK